MTCLAQTSLLAYTKLKESKALGRQETKVYNAVKDLGRASDRMIQVYTQLDINAVTGRRNGLVRRGLIEEAGIGECPIRHNQVKMWRINNDF